MMNRIAPPNPFPEFYIEAGYLRGIVIAWELQEIDVQDSDAHLSVDYLSQWVTHRGAINARSSKRDNLTECIAFVDALIADWFKVAHGQPPTAPLNDFRKAELRTHIERIESVKSLPRMWY